MSDRKSVSFRLSALLAIGLVLSFTLAACRDDAIGIERQKGDPSNSELLRLKAACDASGGTLARGGILASILCFTPLPDAGQACRTSADCNGMCLVIDDKRSCQKVAPLFGCYTFVEDNGDVLEICVD